MHRAHVEDLRQDHAELRDENLLLRMGKRRAVLDSQEHLGRATVSAAFIGWCKLVAVRYRPLNYRRAARTLFLRPYLAHFCPVFSRFFAVFSVLKPGFQKVAPKDRGPVP